MQKEDLKKLINEIKLWVRQNCVNEKVETRNLNGFLSYLLSKYGRTK